MRERAGQQQRARRYEIAAYRSIGVERAFSEEKIKPPKVPRLREKEKEKFNEKEMSTDNIKSKSSSGLDLSSSLLVQQMLFSPKEKNSNDASRGKMICTLYAWVRCMTGLHGGYQLHCLNHGHTKFYSYSA